MTGYPTKAVERIRGELSQPRFARIETSDIQAVLAWTEAARRALKPFGEMGEAFKSQPDKGFIRLNGHSVTWGDFQTAAKLYTKESDQ